MERSVLKKCRIPESNTNQKEKIVMELTSSPNYTEIQKNTNEQDNPSNQTVQPTKDNELQPITNIKNGVFDNV